MIRLKRTEFGRAAALLLLLMSALTIAYGQRGNKGGGGSGGGSGGGNQTPYAIEAMFVYCAPGDTVCESQNRVRMDTNAPYSDGQDGVKAWINVDVSGDLLIDMGSRHVTYDFTQVVNYGDPQPDWWYATPVISVSANINVGNAWAAKEQCGDLPVCEATYITRMNGGAWDTGRNTPNNRLQWNPYSVQPYINTPEDTSPVEVRYIRTETDEMFVITPMLNSQGRYLAGLQAEAKRSVTAAGQYEMPFMLVARLKN